MMQNYMVYSGTHLSHTPLDPPESDLIRKVIFQGLLYIVGDVLEYRGILISEIRNRGTHAGECLDCFLCLLLIS